MVLEEGNVQSLVINPSRLATQLGLHRPAQLVRQSKAIFETKECGPCLLKYCIIAADGGCI